MPPSKLCVVCGDKALGYNFNAVTCESCKAFFRRNALTKREYTCSFSQNCDITVVTRRFCQKCRLKKCFDIGMKSENIMSAEDKVVKREKIEQNRAKRKLTDKSDDEVLAKIKRENPNDASSDHNYDHISISNVSSDSLSCGSTDSDHRQKCSLLTDNSINELSATQMVDCIVAIPERASQTINQLMKNPKEAATVLGKIISSQPDALRLISHLISYPGDALKIISKIMNSPFDALTVFTKFMSSPTDALEIISKIVNSPEDVLQFVKQLMDSPEDALGIMNKFMNTPAEALKIINKMVNSTKEDEELEAQTAEPMNNNKCTAKEATSQCSISSSSSNPCTIINSMLNSDKCESPSSSDTVKTVENSFSKPSSSAPVKMQLKRQNLFNGFFESSFGSKSDSSSEAGVEKKDTLETVLSKVIRLEYQQFNSLPQTCAPGRDLNDVEHNKLNELKMASEALYFPLDEDLFDLIGGEEKIKSEVNQDPQLLTVINLTAVAIKRLIKMSKKINAFRNMCQEDQVALLKGGCTEMMIMRSAMTFDCDRATWKIPHSKEDMSNIKADVLKLASGNVYEEHDRFISTFDPKWRTDENIILIMCAIVLFTPTRPRIIHSEVIKLEQNSYYYLLRRYLESVYPGCEAKSTFIKLIQKISEVEQLNQVIIGVYLNVNPSQIEPLLREIFDLKNH